MLLSSLDRAEIVRNRTGVAVPPGAADHSRAKEAGCESYG
jgi:hypothetical protein